MDSVLIREPIDSLPVANRPYLTLAQFYADAGNPDRAERYSQTWEQALPQVVRDGDPQRYLALGSIALARGRAAEAVTAFRKFRELDGCILCSLYEIGQAFEELGQPDKRDGLTCHSPVGGRRFNPHGVLERELGQHGDRHEGRTRAPRVVPSNLGGATPTMVIVILLTRIVWLRTDGSAPSSVVQNR